MSRRTLLHIGKASNLNAAGQAQHSVTVLSPLEEKGQVGEVLVTKPIQEPNIVLPAQSPPELRQGSPGKAELGVSLERNDYDLEPSDYNTRTRRLTQQELSSKLGAKVPMTIDAFEQVIDQVWRSEGVSFRQEAEQSLGRRREERKEERERARRELESLMLPADHSDYLRNRPGDTLGYAVDSYMSEELRHFEPMESVDDLVDFYVQSRDPDIRQHHQNRFQHLLTKQPTVELECDGCNGDGHLAAWCECCRERNQVNRAEQQKRLNQVPQVPSSFDVGHQCSDGNPRCDYMCKVRSKTRDHYGRGTLELKPQTWNFQTEAETRRLWLERYRQSLSRLDSRLDQLLFDPPEIVVRQRHFYF